jgi:hypothetical protein
VYWAGIIDGEGEQTVLYGIPGIPFPAFGFGQGLIESVEEADILITQLFHDLDSARENSPLPENPPEEVYDLANEFLLECRGV